MDKSVVPQAPLDVTLDGQRVLMLPKRFASGSVGWHLSGKVDIDGVRCQLSLAVIVIGSKPAVAPKDNPDQVLMFESDGRVTAPETASEAPTRVKGRLNSRKGKATKPEALPGKPTHTGNPPI